MVALDKRRSALALAMLAIDMWLLKGKKLETAYCRSANGCGMY